MELYHNLIAYDKVNTNAQITVRYFFMNKFSLLVDNNILQISMLLPVATLCLDEVIQVFGTYKMGYDYVQFLTKTTQIAYERSICVQESQICYDQILITIHEFLMQFQNGMLKVTVDNSVSIQPVQRLPISSGSLHCLKTS